MSTTDLPVELPTDGSSAHQARLAGAVSRLRTRSASGQLDRWLLIIGGTLLPLGLLLVIVGWYGASHTSRLFEQIPYAISGGMLGLGLVFCGGFTYFAYWLTRVVREGREQAQRTTDVLERIETLLASGIVTLDHQPSGGVSAAAAVASNGALVATPTGSMLHRPDCPVVANRDGLLTVEPGTAGYKPCKICQP